MKKIIVPTLLVLTLFGCASTPRVGLIAKAAPYIPGSAQTNLKGLDAEAFQKALEGGFRKLPLEDLYSFSQIRLKTISASRENCLAILDEGAVASVRKQKALETLTDDEYDQYARIIAKAITLSANNDVKALERPRKSEFEKAFEMALDAPTVGQMPKYLTKLPDPTQDQCWSIFKALSYVDQKRNKLSETIVKYIGM
ncbi:MAG: hypothetical protein K2Q18_02650 [Bdellovibrionales bacterium]|nr:hypothetical protein [Bdellovibrionales bacterium]